jgi:hypothetical protein
VIRGEILTSPRSRVSGVSIRLTISVRVGLATLR